MATYSPSKLAAYRECPLKYRFIFVDRIRKPGDPIEAFMGSRVHEALQEVVGTGICSEKDTGYEAASTIFLSKWEEKYNDDVVVGKSRLTVEDCKAKGLRYLKKFFEIESEHEPAEVVGLEKWTDFTLEEFTMKGIIDRLERRGNDFYIIDYKATDHPFTQEKANADWQLGIYELGVRDEFPEAEQVTLIWYFLGPPLVVSSTRNAQQREELVGQIRALVSEIENASEFPPTENRYCYRCDYHLECEEEKKKRLQG